MRKGSEQHKVAKAQLFGQRIHSLKHICFELDQLEDERVGAPDVEVGSVTYSQTGPETHSDVVQGTPAPELEQHVSGSCASKWPAMC